MFWGRWIGQPQRLLIMFLAVMLAIAGTLVWLGWRLLEQDRDLSRQNIAGDLFNTDNGGCRVEAGQLQLVFGR
jgi:hypothetical protein